jgi:hypothetical protein
VNAPTARLVLGALVLFAAGCAANARAKAELSSPESSSSSSGEGPSGFEGSSSEAPAATPETAVSSARAAPATPAAAASSAEPAPPRPGCALACTVATKGRMAAADEARLTQGLADVTESLHQCIGPRIPPMTLRFDSAGTITGFGVPHEPGGITADSCVDAINLRVPAVSYPGPAAVRCAERCRR